MGVENITAHMAATHRLELLYISHIVDLISNYRINVFARCKIIFYGFFFVSNFNSHHPFKDSKILLAILGVQNYISIVDVTGRNQLFATL